MPLVACPHCSLHFKPNEPRCPHCGRTVRQSDGSIALTAGAIVLGIVAAGACDSVETAMPAYGVPDVSAQSSSATSSSGQGGDAQGGQAGAQGGAGGTGGNTGGGGEMAMPAYGVAGMGQ